MAAANMNAATLTVKKRAAWKPARPPPRPERPVAVPPEVVRDGDGERGRGGHQVMGVEQARRTARIRTGSPRSRTRRPRRTSSAEASCAACGARRVNAGVRRVGARATALLASSVTRPTVHRSVRAPAASRRPGTSAPAPVRRARRAAGLPPSRPVERTVAAAADVVRSAPVHELVAGLRGHEHVARVRAAQRRPEPAERVRVRVAAQPRPSPVLSSSAASSPSGSSARPRASASSPPGLKRSSPRPERTIASPSVAGDDEVDALERDQRVDRPRGRARSRRASSRT